MQSDLEDKIPIWTEPLFTL